MKNISSPLAGASRFAATIGLFFFSSAPAPGQTPAFRVTYSEPLAVFQFVDHLR